MELGTWNGDLWHSYIRMLRLENSRFSYGIYKPLLQGTATHMINSPACYVAWRCIALDWYADKVEFCYFELHVDTFSALGENNSSSPMRETHHQVGIQRMTASVVYAFSSTSGSLKLPKFLIVKFSH